MKKLWLLTLIPAILALFYFGTIIGSEKPSEPVKQPEKPSVEEIYRLVNEERAKVGVAPLKLDPRLNQSAQEKADDMATNKYYGHVNPTTGIHGYTLVTKYAKECTFAAENLTGAFSTDNAIYKWTSSKEHYEAMTNKDYSITGIGVVKNNDGYYLVEHFCKL